MRIDRSCSLGNTGPSLTVFAANEKLAALLPPQAKVGYFGQVARRALASRIARSYFGPSRFDPLENLAANEEAADARAAGSEVSHLISRGFQGGAYSIANQNTQLSVFTEGGATLQRTQNSSSRKSLSIASSLINSQRSAIRRKSRKRKNAHDSAMVVAERETRDYTLTGGANRSGITESVCVQPHHMEPFLTLDAKIYSEHCIQEGLLMLKMSLESYGAKLEKVLQETK